MHMYFYHLHEFVRSETHVNDVEYKLTNIMFLLTVLEMIRALTLYLVKKVTVIPFKTNT